MESIGAGSDFRGELSGSAASAGTILVVDDLEANVRLLERLLVRTRRDQRVEHVDDAHKAPMGVEHAVDQLTAEAAGGRRDRDLVKAFERIAERLQVSQRPPQQG